MSDDPDDANTEGPDPEKTEPERLPEDDAPSLLPDTLYNMTIDEIVTAIGVTQDQEGEADREKYTALLDRCRLTGVLWRLCCADRAAATTASDRAAATAKFLLAGKACKLSESTMYELRHLANHIQDIHDRAMAERENARTAGKKVTWPTYKQMCQWFPKPPTEAQRWREEGRVHENLVRSAGEELQEERRNQTERERERERMALHDRVIELEAALKKERDEREQERRDREWVEAQAEQNAREITALRAENAALLAKLAANDTVKTETPEVEEVKVEEVKVEEVEVDDEPPDSDDPPIRETISKAKEWLDGMSEERLAELDTDHELTKFRGTGTVKKVKLDIAKDQRRAAFLLLNRESEQFYDNLALTLRFQRISFWWRVTDDMTILDVQALLPPLDGQEDPSAVDGGAEPEPPAITPSQPMGSPDDV